MPDSLSADAVADHRFRAPAVVTPHLAARAHRWLIADILVARQLGTRAWSDPVETAVSGADVVTPDRERQHRIALATTVQDMNEFGRGHYRGLLPSVENPVAVFSAVAEVELALYRSARQPDVASRATDPVTATLTDYATVVRPDLVDRQRGTLPRTFAPTLIDTVTTLATSQATAQSLGEQYITAGLARDVVSTAWQAGIDAVVRTSLSTVQGAAGGWPPAFEASVARHLAPPPVMRAPSPAPVTSAVATPIARRARTIR